MAAPHDSSSTPGLRERNKLAKEQRIRSAARTLFLEQGFESTTLRDVAAMADVGFGTVFAYASDKSGLLAMVFVEELKQLPRLFEKLHSSDPLDQLVEGLARLYRFWAEAPLLSYHVLRELEFYSESRHFAAIVARRHAARLELEAWIAAHQKDGIFVQDFATDQAAATLFAIYTSAVREWVGNPPLDLEVGLARLRLLMALPLRALTAS